MRIASFTSKTRGNALKMMGIIPIFHRGMNSELTISFLKTPCLKSASLPRFRARSHPRGNATLVEHSLLKCASLNGRSVCDKTSSESLSQERSTKLIRVLVYDLLCVKTYRYSWVEDTQLIGEEGYGKCSSISYRSIDVVVSRNV
jgi:hypothetical protein